VLSEVFSTGTEWDFICLLHAFQLMGGIQVPMVHKQMGKCWSLVFSHQC